MTDNITTNSPKFFATLRTPEQAKQESEDLTKIELDKLMNQIVNNPKLLKPKKLHSNSDNDDSSDESSKESSDESSDSSISYSSSESSKSSKKNRNRKYYKKIDNNNIEIYKKENKIDDLERKLYYKNLHLSNITLKNSKLMNENEILMNKSKENELLLNIILGIIDYSSEKLFKNMDNISKENVFDKRNFLQEQLKNNENKLLEINKKINDITNIKIKKYYQGEVFKINSNLYEKYQENHKLINDYINNMKYYERMYNLIFMILGGIILLILKEFFN